MLAARSDGVGASKHHRNRLLYGPDWISPYERRRAALRRVTRSDPAEFHPSNGVILLDPSAPDPSTVVDLTARRAERAAQAAEAAAKHPSRWQPA
ncbi:MAG: hypothetical protein JNK12_07600 [Acidimicrobiales bacterium]|nr:hypothetical protein [Acidimicrobiales bacterium]